MSGQSPIPATRDDWPPQELLEIDRLGVSLERIERARAARRAKQPPAFRAILEDAKVFSMCRVEPFEQRSWFGKILATLRLCWETDAFLALALYRMRMRLSYFRVPVLPTLLHKLSVALAQVSIGDPVVIEPGIYLPHGQIVIDGIVDIGANTVMAPWVGIGLEIGFLLGAKIGKGVYMGSGARVIGPVRIGSFSQIASCSVVIHDVPERTCVAGTPARVVGPARYKVSFPPLHEL